MLERTSTRLDQIALREQLGAAYAAGALDPAMELLVETQAALRPECRDDLDLAETLNGALLEDEGAAPVAAGAFDRVMSRIGAEPRQEPPLGEAMRAAAHRAGAVLREVLGLPHTVHDSALTALGRGGWTFAGPGMRSLPLELGADSRAEILRIEPGWGAPRHNHRGGEFTLVMTGGFADERGRYGIGDIAYGGPGILHRPIATGSEICYSLAVSEDAPIFMGAFGLLQRLWRH